MSYMCHKGPFSSSIETQNPPAKRWMGFEGMGVRWDGGRGVGFDGMGGKAPHNPCIPCTPLGVHGMQGRASRRDARGGEVPSPNHNPCMGCKAVHPEGMQEGAEAWGSCCAWVGGVAAHGGPCPQDLPHPLPPRPPPTTARASLAPL
ncbi:hypothetical protein COCOBI_pt-1050 (chloroplast) [Coccomyxa sp. Obi]|nr:hypothetical protein COCOBI_pt-1050 [Coccomyxa sp. Obi]